MKTLVDLLTGAAHLPYGVAFFDLKAVANEISYRELDVRSTQMAYHLVTLGVKKGDIVALCLVTSPFFIETFFAVMKAGATPVCSYPPMKLGDLSAWSMRTAEAWQLVGAKLVITDDLLAGLVAHACASAKLPLGLKSEKNFKTPAPVCALPDVFAEDLAFLQFSSGTTGKQKAVALTHQAVIANIEMITNALPAGEHSCVSWLPLYHDMGLVGALLSSFFLARPIALIRPDHFLARPRLWLEVLTKTKATISVAPNFAFGLCVKKSQDLAGLDLSSWQVALCGAETVHAKTLTEFAKYFAPVGFLSEALTPVYGMAEVTLAATFSSLKESPKWLSFDADSLTTGRAKLATAGDAKVISLCTVGRPLGETQIEIRSDDQICEESEVGEIYISSPSLMREYFKDSTRTEEVFQTGKLRTGDRGFLYEGELYLFGRAKEVIIIKGKNIDPSHLEVALYEVKSLRVGRVAACSYVDSELAQEGFYLFAEVCTPELLNDFERIKAQIESTLLREAGVKPLEVILLRPGVLPRTSSGKIQRSQVMELWYKKALMRRPAKSGNLVQYGALSLSGKLRYFGQRLMSNS